MHQYLRQKVEVFEAKFDDPNRQLKRFLKYTSGKVTELVTNWIHLFPGVCYEQVMTLLQERYGDPYNILATSQRETKEWLMIKPDDAAAFRRFFSFLINC